MDPDHTPAGSKWAILPIMLAMFGFAVTSYCYFFIVPVLTSLIAAILLAMAFFRLQEPFRK
jgi:hypothetical protein